MRRLVLAVAVCLAVSAWAGEKLLGTLIVIDGGTTSNRTTGWGAYTGTGSFVIAPPSKISIQCDEDSFVGTDVAGCDAGKCVRLGANQLLPTSVDSSKNFTGHAFNSDGGTAGHAVTYAGGWVAISPAPDAGGSISHCRVFSRSGQE